MKIYSIKKSENDSPRKYSSTESDTEGNALKRGIALAILMKY